MKTDEKVEVDLHAFLFYKLSMVSVDKCNRYAETLNVLACI